VRSQAERDRQTITIARGLFLVAAVVLAIVLVTEALR